MNLSVVIIGKNEEKHIEKCLLSVLKAVSKIDACEIIYVDSASTDRSVEIVKKYPVRVIQLKPDWPLTSSAGRYLGFINTSGKYVFFVDGDTLIFKDWPEKAIDFLEKNSKAGGVAGIVHEIFIDEHGRFSGMKKNRYNTVKTGEVKVFGGIAVYKRSVLEKAGTFNPFIKATPELELSLRVRKEGYSLFRTTVPMAITYAPVRESIREIFRRGRSGLYSMGSTLKLCGTNGTALQYMRERMGFIISFGLLLSGVIVLTFLSLVFKRYDVFVLFAGITGLMFALISIKKKSVKRTLLSFVKRSVILYYTIKSLFFDRIKDPSQYPVDVLTVKE